MIAAALLLAAAAPSVAAAPAKTSLFLKCTAKGAGDAAKAHELQLVFFDPKPDWAKGFNFYDPDRVLPGRVKPEVTNQWPRLLEIELDSMVGGNSALIQLAPQQGTVNAAILNIAVINAAGAGQPGYTGRCTFTDGAAAEAEFKGLMKL